jgi:hypothetical protein
VRRILIVKATALVARGVLRMAPAPVQASSAASATWTKQASAVHRPPGRVGASMAYDAATGAEVLFGGQGVSGHVLGDTWTRGRPSDVAARPPG